MSGRLSAWRRAQRLEERRPRAAIFALAQRLASDLGIMAEVLLAEARRFAARERAAGVTSRRALVDLSPLRTGSMPQRCGRTGAI